MATKQVLHSPVSELAMTSLVEKFNHGWKNGMVANMATFFFLLGEFSGSQGSWANSNPRTRNLASEDFQLEAI